MPTTPKTKSLRQVVKFAKATPEQVYDLLMDSKKHAAFTGESAKISPRVGGKFSAYGGYCEGKNLELVPNKKIVQTWRSAEWELGIESQVTYTLKRTPTGTEMIFQQTGVPAHDFSAIKQGWVDYYWKPMKSALKADAKPRSKGRNG